MKVFSKIIETTAFIKKQKDLGKTIGFVPTMGALHEGHLSLMRQAKSENDLLIVSIFVNPIQFNNKSDLEKYPITFETDSRLLEEIDCDVLFAPTAVEMYPEPIVKNYDFGPLGDVMEGLNRPGHFNGVAIVVKKLFEICFPDKSYFGEKDFQQLAIINKLVKMENLDIEIVPCAIVRESDGLAMSSRNAYLSISQRASALCLSKSLNMARDMVDQGERNPEIIKLKMETFIGTFVETNIEYINFCDPETLEDINVIESETLLAIVVRVGETRLIDNTLL